MLWNDHISIQKNSLKVNFLYKTEQPYSIECYKEDKINDVFNEFAIQNNISLNNLSFKYGIVPISLNSK